VEPFERSWRRDEVFEHIHEKDEVVLMLGLDVLDRLLLDVQVLPAALVQPRVGYVYAANTPETEVPEYLHEEPVAAASVQDSQVERQGTRVVHEGVGHEPVVEAQPAVAGRGA
jgi:hypothetical protein